MTPWVCLHCTSVFAGLAQAGVHARETKHFVLREEVSKANTASGKPAELRLKR